MSKLSSSRPSASRSHFGLLRGLSSLALTGILVAVALGGCSEQQKADWAWRNPFEKKSKATAPDAGTKARRPAPPPPPATASNQPPSNAKPTAEDQKADQVNQDVGNYASNFPADKSNAKPRDADPRTPAIDDDRALVDASSNPRAQRTSARPSPTRTAPPPAPPPTSPPPAVSSDGMGEELVLMPNGGGTTTPSSPASIDNAADISGNSGQPSNANPESTAIVMTDARDNRHPAITDIHSTNETDSSAAGDTDAGASNGRPPVLGSVEIQAGDESDAVEPIDDPANATEIKDTTRITPTPIRPIATDTPPAPPASATMKPEPIETPRAEDTIKPPPAKPTIEEPKPKPIPEEVTPFEDRTEDTPPAKPEPVKPAPIEPKPAATTPIEPKPAPPTPIEAKPKDITTPPTPPANVTPPQPAATEIKRPIDAPARQISDMEAIVARQPNNIDQQLKLRMRYLENGDEARALKPTPGMSEDVARTVIAQIQSVIAAKASDGRTAPEAANKQMESAEAIRSGAAAKADLQVPKVVLCTSIREFGKYTPIDPPTFPAGQSNLVLVYIEVDNFVSKQMADGQYKTLLSLRESVIDQRGRELWAEQTPMIEDISRDLRRDFFLSVKKSIKGKLPPGDYYYKVEVEDLQGNKINSAKTPFKLVAVGKN